MLGVLVVDILFIPTVAHVLKDIAVLVDDSGSVVIGLIVTNFAVLVLYTNFTITDRTYSTSIDWMSRNYNSVASLEIVSRKQLRNVLSILLISMAGIDLFSLTGPSL